MTKEISLKKFLIILIILVLLECLILLVIMPKVRHNKEKEGQDKYCDVAICTEDKTSCYAFKLNKDGKTTITWRGRCDNR